MNTVIYKGFSLPVQSEINLLELPVVNMEDQDIEEMRLMNWHFDICAKIVNQLNLYRLCRPISSFAAFELADFILWTVNQEKAIKNQ